MFPSDELRERARATNPIQRERKLDVVALFYLPALQRIRDLWLELEPLVDATSYDDVVAPTELQISLSDGLGDADAARLDIQWSELGMYSFHYVDGEDVNWRFDRHPNTHSPGSVEILKW
ncbi:hypothetical protein C500_15235 [Natrialba magadii ATCC 43099]|uniref:Uncharacterized protein n=1 Tax=Natrialba magadii (strain ATCC 43099 / DSM 3394 / CCM 3739 / CIP 104546 / IAM 13178 / JCM 8861 / NBRC 102185 / NCIMB 2190 / MS3) TaxID=547559 RepID=L9UQV0_NATMM|nr:hypothetical protein C500_15235 [Natrialba magadii ATCC 43099]